MGIKCLGGGVRSLEEGRVGVVGWGVSYSVHVQDGEGCVRSSLVNLRVADVISCKR